MSSLTLKNLPPELLERLRERAKRERRSLSAEALTILEGALCNEVWTPERWARTAERLRELAEAGGKDTELDVDAIYAARYCAPDDVDR